MGTSAMTRGMPSDLEIIWHVFPESSPATDSELTADERAIAKRIRVLAIAGAQPRKKCGQAECGASETATATSTPIPLTDFQRAKAALIRELPPGVVLSYYEIDEMVAATLGCLSPTRAFAERAGTVGCVEPIASLPRVTRRT
jgi:hypothetical protein